MKLKKLIFVKRTKTKTSTCKCDLCLPSSTFLAYMTVLDLLHQNDLLILVLVCVCVSLSFFQLLLGFFSFCYSLLICVFMTFIKFLAGLSPISLNSIHLPMAILPQPHTYRISKFFLVHRSK